MKKPASEVEGDIPPVAARTSLSHPLQIDAVMTPDGGAIGLTFCPGKTDPHAATGSWARDLDTDLATIVAWGASSLFTLIEDHEFKLLGVPELGPRAEATGLAWHHVPIRDVSVPDERFEAAWHNYGTSLRNQLKAGKNIVVHCRGGLGRTGLVACRLLVELGQDPVEALIAVRAARPGAVETPTQEAYVLEPQWSS